MRVLCERGGWRGILSVRVQLTFQSSKYLSAYDRTGCPEAEEMDKVSTHMPAESGALGSP